MAYVAQGMGTPGTVRDYKQYHEVEIHLHSTLEVEYQYFCF